MKEREAIERFFNRLSINQDRMILLVMASVLMVSIGLSINYRRNVKSNTTGNPLMETPQTIKKIIHDMPLPHSNEVGRINHIKEALIQMKILSQKPVLSVSDSMKFRNIMTELKLLGVSIE